VTFACADLSLDGTDIQIRRAGDSEVWARRAGRWSSLFPTETLTPERRAAFRQHPGADLVAAGPQLHWQAHVDLLDDPAAWVSPPLGLEFPARVQRATLSDVEELILSTDGACLNAERCADLRAWLSGGLQRRQPGNLHPSPHGDIAVLRAQRR
jgi:hypothetical protein